MRLISFWIDHRAEVLTMLQQHVLLVGASTLAAIAIGVPAGILAAGRPRIGRPLIAAVNIAQTIPSLALLGFLIPLPFIGGIGPRAAIVALILYALLPIVRMTIAGLQSIDPAVREAGVAMGMTPRQLLRMVELPLAMPSIVAGIRVATVIGVGTATIAAFIGAGGLGDYIFRGLSMVDGTMILAGAVPAALLALVADAALTRLERRVSSDRGAGVRRGRLAAAAAVALAVAGVALISAPARPALVIGSKNFTEQLILGELLAQVVERDTNFQVARKLNLGGTFICDRAIRAGEIDAYVEYTGTALTAIFHQPVAHDRQAVTAATRELYAKAAIAALEPLGFNNTFAMLVRRGDAERLKLRTIGDLATAAATIRGGYGHEFLQRQDGYPGLVRAYGLQFAVEPRVMDLTLMYRALADRQIDLIAGDATSGLIDALDLAALEDDRRYFPPYDAVPLVRSAVLLRYPEVGAAIGSLAGRVSEEDMRALNRAVDVDRRDVAQVVREFLATRKK
jgi:osmoprotectant transport system permease protein